MRASGIPRDRVHFVPNAHDGSTALSRQEARAILGFDDQTALVGWIGRLSYEKGADRFVRVIDSLRSLSRGIVIGDGPERGSLERQIAATGAPVVLVGARPDAARLVSAFDVLAITSRTEGLPMTVLHAMAAEVPVVATSVGALPDALGDSAGWLVDPASESDFSAALREAIEDRDAARARARRGRARLERLYSLDGWLDAMNRVYDRSAT
jgi:glycosyltransferase involved in cell wall biosynthesis